MTTTTTIGTLRHARTTFGAEMRYAGSIDVPLSEEGIRDCAQARGALAQMHFDVVITSTQKRAIATALLLGFDAASLVRRDLCRERNFGIMEGMSPEEVRGLDPPVLFIRVGDDSHSVNPKGSEPFEDVWERAKKLMRLVFREYKGSSILIVSHGVFLQMFHGVLRGSNCIESLGAYPGNLQLSTFHFTGRRFVDEDVRRLSGPAGVAF